MLPTPLLPGGRDTSLRYICVASCSYDMRTLNPPFVAEMKQNGLVPSPSKALEKRVTVTDGTQYPLTGTCIYFIRPNNTKPISTSNIVEVSVYITTLPLNGTLSSCA